MLHLPSALADQRAGKIDKMSACPDANGTGIADATQTKRHKAKKNARHARSTAGEVSGKQKFGWGINHPSAHYFIMHLCVFTVRTTKDCQSLQLSPQMLIRQFANVNHNILR
jgi:hypothetical protein